MKHSYFQRFLAFLLCFAMVLPNLTGLAWAAEPETGAPSGESQRPSGWVPVDPEDIPAYTTSSGKVSKELECECGNGLTQDGAQSHLTMVTGTNENEYRAYLGVLEQKGFQKTFENTMAAKSGANLFSKWLSPKGDYVLTVYFSPYYREVHIVADTAEDMVKSFSGGFRYESTTGETAEVMMTMYGLSISPNGYDITTTRPELNTNRRNCGAFIVIRMPDNSLFINDGGDLEQWSDEFCLEVMEFFREITGKQEGEKVVINTWFVSHAHTDHYKGIPRFFDKYHDQIDIKNVMYSLDDEMTGSTRDMSDVMKMISAYFPEVKYYKPHTGDKFDIAGIGFEVLYTQEDRFLPAADGSLSVGDPAKKERNGITARSFLYSDAANKETDFNDTSTVLKVTFPKELTGTDRDYDSILYADVNLADQVLIDMYAPSVLATDIMMVPHHGHDTHPELVAMSGADIFLYTQHKQAIYGPDGDYTKNDAFGTFREDDLVYNFKAMQDQDADGDGDPDLYFDTTATRKTYWEGNETAVIVFGEGKSFSHATALGMTKDAEDPADYSVYTKAAPTFEYEGWTLFSTVVGSDSTTTDRVTSNSGAYRADGVEVADTDDVENNILVSGEKYVIVHDKTDLVMSYTAMNGTKTPQRPGSFTAGTGASVAAGEKDIYFKALSGTNQDDAIYFPSYMRDQILWEFTLLDIFDQTDEDGDITDELVHNTSTPRFGGVSEEHFYRSYWYKGLSSNEVFWTVDPANADTAWRFLVPSNDDLVLKGSNVPNYNTRIEFFDEGGTTDTDGDGILEICDTCVIYWHNNSGLDDFRFLTVDESGNWIQKKYSSINAAKAELEELKLRLYHYVPQGTTKVVLDSTGPQTYSVVKGTAQAEVIDSIAYQLAVRQTNRNSVEIPCSGIVAKAGYWWLDGTMDTSVAGQSQIQVKYRNDDGTDTLITTLNMVVEDRFQLESDVKTEGLAAEDSTITGNVFESRTDSGEVIDCVISFVTLDADGFHRREVSVNVGMLRYDGDSTVTVPGGSATSVGPAGVLVDTDVEPGTVYHGLTLTYDGLVLTDDFTLTIQRIDAVDQPKYPQPGSVTVDKTGTPGGASFSTSGIANIQLSATGIPQTEGVDLVISLDMSGSMIYAVSSADPTSRLQALKDSMKGLIDTLYDHELDFRIAISDFGDLDNYYLEDAVVDKDYRELSYFDTIAGTDWNDADQMFGTNYELYNHLNFVYTDYQVASFYHTTTGQIIDQAIYDSLTPEQQADYNRDRDQPWNDTITKWNKVHDQYIGNLEPYVYTGSNKTDAEAFVSVKSMPKDYWYAMIDGFRQGSDYLFGTNYDRGLEYMYRLGYAIQQHNIDNGLDREVVGIFMSDGAPMQYNYFSSRTVSSAWGDWFSGRIDPDKFQSAAFNETVRPAKLAELEDILLRAIKTSGVNVNNPDALFYRSSDAEVRQIAAGIVDENGAALYKDNTAVRGVTKTGTERQPNGHSNGKETYFKLHNIDSSKTLYNAMIRNGITLDAWGFQRIAAANGITIDMDTATQAEIKAVDAQLLEIAKQATETSYTLRYPIITNPTRYLHDPDATDLYASIEAQIGRKIGYTDLVQIAYQTDTVTLDGVEYKLRQMLRDIMAEVTTMNEGYEWATLSPYHYFYNEEGKNWWAEAIKGSTDELYPVINKYAHDETYDGYNGTVRNYYDDGSDAAWAGQDYMGGFRGLDIPIYTLGMSIGDTVLIRHEDTQTVLENIASGENYAFAAYSGDDLNAIFASIASSVASSASRAYFVDTLGEDYDLQTTVIKNVEPTIEVRDYVLDRDHQRTGAYHVLERVTFEGDGVAKSTAVFHSVTVDEVPTVTYPDIWGEDGVIDGKYFYYNANTAGTNVDRNGDGKLELDDGDIVDGRIRLDLSGDGVPDYTLAPETFFWILGTIGSDELVLDYPVVLTGSDSEDPAVIPDPGKYPTNESAKLYYVNYLGNDVFKDTVSPEFSWGDSMSVDKKAEKQEEDYLLTLEAFANGQTTQFNKTEPADIVLVLDQSASMYTPAGYAADNLQAQGIVAKQNNGELPLAAKITDFAAKVAAGDPELMANAMRPGYYIAVHNTYDYIYIVQYIRYDRGEDLRDPSDDKWGWFYVPVPNTTTPVEFDPANATNDTSVALASGGTYAQTHADMALLTNVTYYKSQYGALYDSVTAFVKDLSAQAMKTGVQHRVAIVGFASPYYDAMDHYQGTGIYIDGQYYLYDDEYLYKGRYENGVLVRDDANGTVILDPDRGYANEAYPMNLFEADPSEYSYVGIGDRYSSAFVDVSTEAGLESVMASVDAIRTNYLQTCPAIGLRIARSIFRGKEIPLNDPLPLSTTDGTYKSMAEELIQNNDPTNMCPEGKDQVIILFTDGIPTVSMYADYEKSGSATQNREVNSEYWTGNGGVQDAINEAHAAKREGVKVYTIGTAAASNKYGNKGDAAAANKTASGGADERIEFLDLLSSNYPYSTCVHDVVPNPTGNDLAPIAWNFYVDYGTKATDRSYAMSATEENALTIAFTSVMESITAPTVELDQEDILRDVLSDYFEFIGKNADEIRNSIKVYTADFKADGSAVSQDQWVPLSTAQIRLDKTDPTVARYDIVEVTGYDYHTMYFSTTPRQVDGEDYYGSKLIVQIPVKVTAGFTGGVDVPTNEDPSGIYDVEEGGETIVIPFPIPTVDIDSGMVTDKKAEPVEGTDNQYLLTLEAYATGSLRELTATKPADIVLVLDHSASMRTPVGATEVLYNQTYYGGQGKFSSAVLDTAENRELATHMGYFVAQSTTSNAWFIMHFDKSINKWHLYNVPSTESVVNLTGWTEHTQRQEYSIGALPDWLDYYKSQYAMLYDSVLNFVTELRDSNVAHNVSIVGFAGSETSGSRLYVGGDETDYKNYANALYNPNTTEARRTELYQKAMKNVVMDTEYSELLTLVDAIHTNFSYTCPAVGLKMANEIFAANPVDAAARDRIVILFTDGLPNVMIGEEIIDDSNTSEMIFDEIIAQAYTAKEIHGAQVYSISTSTTGDKASDRMFLSYVSSDYPDAHSFADHGEPIEGHPVYTKEVSAADDLEDAFGNVTEHFSSTTVKLDGNTLLVEILSEYFDLLNNGGKAADGTYMDVRVYKQLYRPDTAAKWGEKIPLGDAAVIELSSSDGSDRMDTVTVSGFDYAKEYISEITREDDDGNPYYGSKLVLEVDIITREGFWGGEGVPTNDVKTGLYPPDSDVPAEIFPVPEVDLRPDVRVEDVIVLDYGMGVEIDLSKTHPLLHGESQILGFVDHIPAEKLATTLVDHWASEDGTFGGAVLHSGAESKIRYELDRDMAMKMDGHETFHYVGQYTADQKTSYYYGTIKVVPATVMYFEEHFLDYTLDSDMMAVEGWTSAGEANDALTTLQDEDRPGQKHQYGHDSHYLTYDEFSMGDAQKINVMQGKNGAATFRFKGTGFDVISLSSRDTGTVLVNVYRLDEDGKRIDEYDSSEEFGEPDEVVNAFRTSIVDTYYGYSYQDGQWVLDGGTGDNALYQVPVIKMEGLPYDLYEVEVYVAYTDIFAVGMGRYPDKNYDFYVDAIRIYDPANDGVDDQVIGDAYEDDGERWPVYEELRNMLLPTDKATEIGSLTKAISLMDVRLKDYDDCLEKLEVLTEALAKEDDLLIQQQIQQQIDGLEAQKAELEAQFSADIALRTQKQAELDAMIGGDFQNAIFIDGKDGIMSVGDYIHYGPNNEMYLAPGQSIYFQIDESDPNMERVQLAMKTLGGVADVTITSNGVALEPMVIGTSTDLYYDFTGLGQVTITNEASSVDAILSITNVKTTYKEDPYATGSNSLESGPFKVDGQGLMAALMMLNGETVTDPELTLQYPSLSFEDEVFYNVYFTAGDISDVEEMGLMILPSFMADGTMADAIGTVPGYITNGVMYMVRSEGIAAACMGDTVYFKVYAKLSDGSYVYSEVGGYNAKAYANTILTGNYPDAMKALVVSMLTYGAEAQKFFGHNTDKLMDAGLTDEQKALIDAYDADMMDAIVKADSNKTGSFVRVNSNFRELYPSVSFDGAFAINLYCTPVIPVDSGMTLYWWDAESYASADTLTLENAVGSMEMTTAGGIWCGQVPGIAARDMDKTYYMTCVFESGDETVTTGVIAYSLGAYCESKAGTEGDAQQAFAQATAVYGYYAKQYFAQN